MVLYIPAQIFRHGPHVYLNLFTMILKMSTDITVTDTGVLLAKLLYYIAILILIKYIDHVFCKTD